MLSASTEYEAGFKAASLTLDGPTLDEVFFQHAVPVSGAKLVLRD